MLRRLRSKEVKRTFLVLLIVVLLGGALAVFAQDSNGNQTPGDGVLIEEDHHMVIHNNGYFANAVVQPQQQTGIIRGTSFCEGGTLHLKYRKGVLEIRCTP